MINSLPKQHLLVAAVYLAVGFLAFANGLHGPFMVDDHITFGSWVKGTSIAQELIPYRPGSGKERREAYYRPVQHTSLIIFHRLFGEHYFFYHAANLALFLAAAFFIFYFSVTVLAQPVVGLWAGLFFLVHPINGILVNYITASVFSFEVIFMLASLIWFMRSLDAPRAYYFPASVAAFILAILSHETALLLPFYLFVLLTAVRRMTWKPALRRCAVFFGILSGYFIFRLVYASFNDSLFGKADYFQMDGGEYLASLAKVAWWYISRLFYPDGIVIIWATPVVRHLVGWWVALLLCLAGFWAYLTWEYRQERILLLALLWFGLGLAPLPLICLLQPFHGFIIEPHWFVFSSIGFFVFIAALLVRLFKKPAWALIAVLLLWLVTTRLYNEVWSDERRYCRYWLEQAPTLSVVAYHLARVYEVIDHDLVQAKIYYAQALDHGYRPQFLYNHLGWLAMRERNWREMYQNFYGAYKLSPGSWSAANNLGVAAYQLGEYGQARVFFQQALTLNPDAEPARSHLHKTMERMR